MHRNRWLGIELRHFAALEAIARERSFRGAAHRLGYAQSAISRQVAFLEQVTGTRLIERSQGPRPVHLTEAGDLLLQHANDVLASMAAAETDLALLADGRTAEVRVGTFPGVPSRILAGTLSMLATNDSELRVTATETATDGPLFKLLEAGDIDMAFATLPAEQGPFASCELLRVPWALIVPAGSELARRASAPTCEELARLPLVGVKSSRLGRTLEASLHSGAGAPRFVFRSDVPETACALAAAGVGAAFVPRLAVEDGDARTAVIDLEALIPPMSVGLVWHRNRRLQARLVEFRDTVRKVAASLPGQAGRRSVHQHKAAARWERAR